MDASGLLMWTRTASPYLTATTQPMYQCQETLLPPRFDFRRHTGQMSNETYDFILGLRTIRSYRAEPLADDHLAAILEAARWTGSAKNRQDWSFIVVSDPDQRRVLADCGDFTDPIRSSAVTIAIVQEPGGYEFDSGRVAQSMMLAAKSLGVASCPVTLHRSDDAASMLALPEGRRVRYAVALGYPSADAAPARFGGRKKQGAIVHRERYG